jgi:hypothetical protein
MGATFYLVAVLFKRNSWYLSQNMLVINFIVKVKPEYTLSVLVLLTTVTLSIGAGALGTVTLFSLSSFSNPRLVGTEIARGPFNSVAGLGHATMGNLDLAYWDNY